MYKDTEYVFVKRFFLHTFAYRLKETGISIQSVRYGICPDEATGMYTFSRPLEPVLKRALKKVIICLPKQCFIIWLSVVLGKKNVGFKDAQEVIHSFMKHEIGRNPDNYSIVDGSGVSLTIISLPI